MDTIKRIGLIACIFFCTAKLSASFAKEAALKAKQEQVLDDLLYATAAFKDMTDKNKTNQ